MHLKNGRLAIFLVWMALIATGCSTSGPTYTSVHQQSHGTVEYIGPSFHTSITTAGYVSMGLSAGIGGVAGFFLGREIRIEDSTGKAYNPDEIGGYGAVGGAFIGWILAKTTIVARAAPSTRLPANRVSEWIASIDEDLILIRAVPDERKNDTIKNLIAVSKTVADTFEIRSVDDAAFFYDYFPRHERQEEVVAQAAERFSTRDFSKLAALYPTSPAVKLRLKNIVAQCGSVESCIQFSEAYPEFHAIAIDRARMQLAKFDDPKSLQRLAEANPEIFEAADSLAAVSARRTGDAVGYLNAFPRGSYRDEFVRSVLSSIDNATTVRELAEIAKRYPRVRIEAERRAADLAISQREYTLYGYYFPDGRSRDRVNAAIAREKSSRVSTSTNAVASTDRWTSNDGDVQSWRYELGCAGKCCKMDYCVNTLRVEISNDGSTKTKQVTLRVIIKNQMMEEIYNEIHVVNVVVPPNMSMPTPDFNLKRYVTSTALYAEISVTDAKF